MYVPQGGNRGQGAIVAAASGTGGPWAALARAWGRVGLVTKFLFLIAMTLLAIAEISERMGDRIAARSMLESSLEVEQALARAAIVPALGTEPLVHAMPAGVQRRLDAAVRTQLDPGYISKVKVWGTTGRLLYDSHDPVADLSIEVPAVLRALNGETVSSLSDFDSVENVWERGYGDLVHEVYMPFYTPDGRLLAVGEIYCSVDLVAQRIRSTVAEIDRMRLFVLIGGVILMTALVWFAQRHIATQDHELLLQLRATEELARRNERLLIESERLRQGSTEAGAQLLDQIGAELHDGPIQLLSLAELYRSQGFERETTMAGKAKTLSEQALKELRHISMGLILPELEGLSLQAALQRSCLSFTRDTGLPVDLQADPDEVHLPMAELVVAYRVVQESLHNARKHAGGNGLRVTQTRQARRLQIVIEDDGPGPNPPDPAPATGFDGPSLGLVGMQKRARSVGGDLMIQGRERGTLVRLVLPETRLR